MRSPGHDIELALGFLAAEGIVEQADDVQLASMNADVVEARLGPGVLAHHERLRAARRELLAVAACGVCGRPEMLPWPKAHEHAPPLEQVAFYLDRLRETQQVYDLTGGLHGAALFRGDTLLAAREDIGRHNAVDKLIGWQLQSEADGDVLAVSSRVGFEIVQKAAVLGVRHLVAAGACSSLAAEIAAHAGIWVYAFVRPDRHVRL